MSSHISWVWSLEEKKTACTLHLLKDFTVYCQSKYIYTKSCMQQPHVYSWVAYFGIWIFFLNVQYPQDLHIQFNCQMLKLSHFTSKANRNEFINSNNHVWIFSWYFTNFVLSSLGRIGVLLSNINFNKAKLLYLL